MRLQRLLLLSWCAAAAALSSSDAPSAGSTSSSAAAATGAAPVVAAANETQQPDTANATAPATNETELAASSSAAATATPTAAALDAATTTATPNATTNATASLLHALRDRLAYLRANVSLRPVRKKLANLTGLHGFVSNKNNGSAASRAAALNKRVQALFVSAPANGTVNATNTTVAKPLAPPCATIACVTWNLAAESPTAKDAAFLEKLRRHDLVCICVQELEDLKPRRTPGQRAEAWTRLLAEKFPSKTHQIVADQSAGPVRLTVLQKKKSKLLKVEACATGDVACGIGNVLRNKGCAAAFLDLKVREGKTSATAKLLVVSAHLAAHAHKASDRDADYHRICRELLPQMPQQWGSHDLLDCVDGCLFAGDLNYRLDLPREEAERGALSGDFAALLEYDQLKNRKAAGCAFEDFFEGPIDFAPTFKFDPRSSTYDSSKKQRVPSWTDRVLYVPRGATKRSPELVLASYGSVDTRPSDHRPVVATFALRPRQTAPAPLDKRRAW